MTFDDVTRPEISKCFRIILEFNVLLVRVSARHKRASTRSISLHYQSCVLSAALYKVYCMDKKMFFEGIGAFIDIYSVLKQI